MGLLPLDEVRRRLRIVGQSDAGLQAVAVERIVGSVGRSADFRRDFAARRSLSRSRLAALRAAFGRRAPAADRRLRGRRPVLRLRRAPPGRARERGTEYLDAHVTRLHTNYELPPDVDVAQLVHTEQQRLLMEESGLARTHPEAVIDFARPRGYPELLETIKAHGYDLARRRGELPSQEEVAADWYDHVYRPGVAAAQRAGLPRAYPFKTEADLFPWIYERRRDLRVREPDADFDAAAAYALREGVGRRDRRVIESEAAKPLEPRADQRRGRDSNPR